MEKKIWTKEELQDHIKLNSNDTYSLMVPLSALYKKLYGEMPKVGLSGFQGENAEQLAELFPDPPLKTNIK